MAALKLATLWRVVAMQFLCECGHVIRDQTDYLPYKAYLVRDEDLERFQDAVDALIAQGIAESRKESTATPVSFIHAGSSVRTIELFRSALTYVLHLYECETCGRLYVERHRGDESNRLIEYLPFSGKVERVLASPNGSPVRKPGVFRPTN
jgi:hypothetical protein